MSSRSARRVSCLLVLLIAATFLSGPLVAAEPDRGEGRAARWPPRLWLNSDCGTPVFYRFDAPMSAEHIARVVDDLPGTAVDAFLPCPQFSDDQFWYPLESAEPYDGRQVPDGKFEDMYFKRVAGNVKSLIDRKLDPMLVWQRRSRKHGLMFIPSLRMNDVHKDYVDRWPSLRSTWEKQRRHLLIGKQVPGWYTHPYTYSWAMDYAHAEVRDRKLTIITELCTRYDVDGFELDFLRSGLFFRRGHEPAGRDLMTDLVHRIRVMLDDLGRKRKRPLRLVVRVPTSVAQCQEQGLDVPRWIRDGLLDMVVPMDGGYLDMTAPVEQFVALARGTRCKVAGGLEYYIRGYVKPKQQGITQASLERLRAAAASFWSRGVDAIYLFNYDCHGPFPFRDQKRQALNEIHDPARLAGTDQHYFVTREMSRETPVGSGYKQLPAELKQDGTVSRFTIAIGDDVPKKPTDTDPRSTRLVVRTTLSPKVDATLKFVVNGTRIEPTLRKGTVFFFDQPPMRKGTCTLEIGFDPPRSVTVRIEEIEFLMQRDLPGLSS